MNWNKSPLRLWQTKLNFAVFCTSSAWGVSSKHLNYKKHPMVKALYRFMNPYSSEEFFKLCEDYEVFHDPKKYRDEKFYWTYQ